ncbi:hypothetical protein EXIGLDRAFT_845091 [Exidia glandulosa HHB12029]|uniref:Uncharacterized protein n=1 Tax=Exidia glandulosa HHB12029 TaxID=1314781 RepID=A0A165BNF5_EXIGL|nr:hypothetical protein EXIGLDRAFT_845091 [Exidia glandulosa HHB12029]
MTDLTIPSTSHNPFCLPIDFSVPAFGPSDGHVTVTTSPRSSEKGTTLCEASARVTLPMKVSLESLSLGYVDYSWLWLENKEGERSDACRSTQCSDGIIGKIRMHDGERLQGVGKRLEKPLEEFELEITKDATISRGQ